MQPIHPIETRTPDQEYDYVEDSTSGPSWPALIAVVLVLVLLIGAVLVFDGEAGSDSNEVPAPTEAPLDPGA